MGDIKISVEIREDRRLIIDLPSDTPLGTAQITIQPAENRARPLVSSHIPNAAREAARHKLLAAGILSAVSDQAIPADFVRLSDEELLKLASRPLNSPSIDQIIDEDRGPR